MILDSWGAKLSATHPALGKNIFLANEMLAEMPIYHTGVKFEHRIAGNNHAQEIEEG